MTSRKKLDNPWAVRYIRRLNGQSRARRTVTQRAEALTQNYGGVALSFFALIYYFSGYSLGLDMPYFSSSSDLDSNLHTVK